MALNSSFSHFFILQKSVIPEAWGKMCVVTKPQMTFAVWQKVIFLWFDAFL